MRFRLTAPLVVSGLALAVALGGASYAALTLPANSVGAKQIKKNAVTSAKVRDGSLLAADFKAGQLPQGTRGEQGTKGDTGARGPSDAYYGQRQYSSLLTLTGTLQPVAVTPSLPAGSYVAVGRANLIGDGGSGTGIICALGSDAVQGLPIASGGVIPLTMSAGITLPSDGTIAMTCLRGTGPVKVAQAAVVATRVETLVTATTN